MKHLVEFPLEGSGSVLVEVDDTQAGRVARGTRPGEVAEKANQTFEAALDKIKPAAQAIITQLRGLNDEPDEVSVEFGIKLSAEAGAFIASAGVEANYKVSLKWVKPQPVK